MREAERLAARGVKELLLISQDTTFYGIDRGERGALARLLRALNRVDGLEWIRMLYLYPTTIADDVLEAMAESEKVCKYIDLPLQHASDAVLKRMKRPGTRAGYERLLDRIRTRVPGVTLRTTFIVGFPGETDARLCRARVVRRRRSGSTTSACSPTRTRKAPRPTASPTMCRRRSKRQRQAGVMRLQKRIVERAQRRAIGQQVRMLVDGPSAEHDLVLRGRLEGQAPEIDPLVYLTDCDPSALIARTVRSGRNRRQPRLRPRGSTAICAS